MCVMVIVNANRQITGLSCDIAMTADSCQLCHVLTLLALERSALFGQVILWL